jgi:hypothetical protein
MITVLLVALAGILLFLLIFLARKMEPLPGAVSTD